MKSLPLSKTHEVFCDASTVKVPEKVSFFYKSSVHHDTVKGRVHVDFTLQIRGFPVDYFGYWRSRISFWLCEELVELDSESAFEYYKRGFRTALAEAEKFVESKYRLKSSFPPPSDEALWEKYQNSLVKK